MKEIRKKDYEITSCCYQVFDVLTYDEFRLGKTRKTFSQRLDLLNRLNSDYKELHPKHGACWVKPLKQERITCQEDFDRWAGYVEAGNWAAAQFPGLTFWDKNWRQGGLQERRSQIIKEQDFYNQRYCGCEFSMQAMHDDKKQTRQRIKKLVSVMTPEQKAAQSAAVWERLEQNQAFKDATDILAYWSMDDEVLTPAFIDKWTAAGKRFYLPSIQGDDLIVKRYNGSLHPGEQFGIP